MSIAASTAVGTTHASRTGGPDRNERGREAVVVVDAQLATAPHIYAQSAGTGEDAANVDVNEPGPTTAMRQPAWQRDFWRWSAGIGWTLDLLLLSWALFLRQAGFVEKQEGSSGLARVSQIAGGTEFSRPASQEGATDQRFAQGSKDGSSAPALDDTMYAILLRRSLGEQQSLTVSDGVLGGLLRDESRNLGRLVDDLKATFEGPQPTPLADAQDNTADMLGPQVEDPIENLKLLTLIDDLKAKVASDRDFLRQRDAQLLNELEEKPTILLKLSERVLERRLLEAEAPATAFKSPSAEELGSFASGAILPFAVFLAAILMTTVLSQQMLRVATAWREQRVSDGDRRRRRWGQRFRLVIGMMSTACDAAAKGELPAAQQKCNDVVAAFSTWAKGPTWGELAMAELAEFWERWGPQAWGLRIALPQKSPGSLTGRSFLVGLIADPGGIAEEWRTSVEAVAQNYGEALLAAWAKEDDGVSSQAFVPTSVSSSARTPIATALVIRIFGGWGSSAESERPDWVNIANIPLAGDWREKALRLLIPAEEDKRDVPILGDVCEALLTAVVANQVSRVVSKSVWGSLTTDLWRRYGYVPATKSFSAPFQIGYEVVEVASKDEEEMLAIARAMPVGGERVVRVPQVEAEIRGQRR